MAGLLQLYDQDRKQGLGQMGYLAGLEGQRDAFNEQQKAAAANQRKTGLASGATTFATMAAMGNPVGGAVVGGLQILGSLF